MKKIKIVTDSSSDVMSLEYADFASAPLKIITSEKEFTDNEALDVDGMVAYLEKYKGKKILFGIYMYDFYNRKPVPNDLMELQCNYALELLKEGRIDGMIFEANSVMGARLPSEYWLREWVDKVKYPEVPD